jgi:hypothetical protein
LADDFPVPPISKVDVVLGGSTVPAWQDACVQALSALDGVRVNAFAGDHRYEPPRGIHARLTGKALAAATPSGTRPAAERDPTGADVVVDLTAGERPVAGREVWRLRFDGGDDADGTFVRAIARDADALDVALVRHTAESNTVLRTGRFPVTRWYPSTLRWTLFSVAAWPAILVAAINAGATLEEHLPAAAAPAAAAPLRWSERIAFAAALARRLGGYVVERAFASGEWNVGFADAGAAAIVDGTPLDARWLPKPVLGTWDADPFVVERGGTRMLFVEAYDETRGRGVIDALELGDGEAVVRRATIIDTGKHLSYPYAFSFEGVDYIVPESAAAREVALYRAVEYPWRWERERAIIPDLDALDTTIFVHDDRWWALCTRASRGSDFALYAFYADSLHGPWQPHALNPIVEDVTRARPAGAPFAHDGALYRPGQNCARAYGSGLTIARIDELTPLAYRETVVRRIDAHCFGRYADGVHTLGLTSRGIVIDGKRATLDPLRPLRRILAKRAGSHQDASGSTPAPRVR